MKTFIEAVEEGRKQSGQVSSTEPTPIASENPDGPTGKKKVDPTKPNESKKQIAKTAANNNSDAPSPVDMTKDPKRFNHGSNEVPRTPEEQANIDAHDKEVESTIDGYGSDIISDTPGYGDFSGYGTDPAYMAQQSGYTPLVSPRQPYSLEDINAFLGADNYHIPDAKDLKREKRDMMIRALGDGISAIAGMAGSIKGGPNTVDASNNLTKSGREMVEKLREERRKNYTAYLNAALKREQADAANMRARAYLERSREVSRREAMKAEHAIKMAEQKMKLAQDKQAADEAYKEAMAEIQRERLRIQDEYNKGRLAQGEARLAIQRLDAETRRINANRPKGGGGSGGGKSGSSSSDTITLSWNEYTEDGTKVHASGKFPKGTTVDEARKQKAASGGGNKPASGGGGKPAAPNWTKRKK